VRQRAQALKAGTDCFVIARMVASHGIYMTSSHLRGVEQFFIDMSDNPDFVLALVERVTQIQIAFTKIYLEACGEYIDMIELPGDDYATNIGMAFSPRMFRRYFKPFLGRIVEAIKNYRPDIFIMAHCDGALQPILQDFIDIGVDAVHPLEPLPSVDHADIKAKFGHMLSFLGGIDIVQALPSTSENVIQEVKRRIRQLAPGGGYILAPANHIQTDVPVENLILLYEAAREHGRYPIKQE
jgi:uroporphyrinogen decarboxylase